MSAASFFWASSLMVARPLFNWLVSASTSWFRLSYSAFLGPNLLLISVAAFCPSLVLAMACDMLMIAILVGIASGAACGLAGACGCPKAEAANPKRNVLRTTELFFKLKLLIVKILP